MAVRPRHKLTYDDFVLFPDDGLRRELIDGEVYVSPSPYIRHQRLVGLIYYRLREHLERNGGGEVFVAPCDVLFSHFDVVEPDVIFISDANSGVVTEANIKGVPNLVVEVVSNPRLDRVKKRDLYARYRVPEYWIVDPDADQVEVYRLGEKGYTEPEILKPGETLTTKILPGLALDLTDLLRR